MKIEMRSRKVNGAGDITGTIAVLADDGRLLYEDVVNLSKRRAREAFISEVAERAKVPTDRARGVVLQLLSDERTAYLEEAGTPLEEPKQERKADKLVREVLESGAELFHDQRNDGYMALDEGTGRGIYRVGSTAFRRRLGYMAFVKWGEIPSSEALGAASNVMAGVAIYQGDMHPLHVRTAWHDGTLYYDLGDMRAVAITKEGWDIEDRPPILFRRFSGQTPQVEPIRGGELMDLLPLVNLRDDDAKLLFLTDLAAGLIPGIPRPLTVLHGPQGSGKSLLLRFKRLLQDPARPLIQGMPKDEMAFLQMASHNLCVLIDNLSSLPVWLSDGMSRFCSGDGFVKRTLFTDEDDYIMEAQGIGALVGINLIVSAPDLLDRAIIYQMERPSDSERLEETDDLLPRFDALRPALVGAMFEALSMALQLRDEIPRPAVLPRLADYARWGCATAVALGYSSEDYWAALKTNANTLTEEALDASPVARAVMSFMADKEVWQGTPGELLSRLNDVAQDLRVDTSNRAWPKDARWVTRRLNLVIPNLAQVGISFTEKRDKNQRAITLRHKGNDVTVVMSSPTQLVRQ